MRLFLILLLGAALVGCPDDDDDSALPGDDDATGDDDSAPLDGDGDGWPVDVDCDDSDPTVGLAAPDSPEEILCAMGVPLGRVVPGSPSFGATGPDLSDPRGALGILTPPAAPRTALLANIDTATIPAWPGPGPSPVPPDPALSTLAFEVEVPEGSTSLQIDWYFLSHEYPEWVGDPYNAHLTLDVAGTAWSGQALTDAFGNLVTVNCALFTVTNPAQLAGTGFEQDGGTGWRTVDVPVAGGTTLGLHLEVGGASAAIWTSAALLSGFRFLP